MQDDEHDYDGCLGVSGKDISHIQGTRLGKVERGISWRILGTFWENLGFMWTGGTILSREAETFHVLGHIPFTSYYLHRYFFFFHFYSYILAAFFNAC